MWIFLLTILPLIFTLHLTSDFFGKKLTKDSIFIYLSAALVGLTYIIINALSVFPKFEPFAHFGKNFVHFFLFESFLPLLGCLLIFIIFSKNEIEYCLENLFVFFAGFLTFFLPYNILTNTNTLTFFLLFVKPILFVIMIISLRYVLLNLISMFRVSNPLYQVLNFLLLILVISFPAIIESLWWCAVSWIWIVFLFILNCVNVIMLRIYCAK
ncbi:MAG: hypothetical protein GX220_08570 [Treponema sp.]|nr:hypothetical protein [Treponema sp.]